MVENQNIRVGNTPQKALSNEFTVQLDPVLKEAWLLSRTSKQPFLFGALIIYVVATLLSVLLLPSEQEPAAFMSLDNIPSGFFAAHIVSNLIISVMLAGLLLMGLRNAAKSQLKPALQKKLPVNHPNLVFYFFKQPIKIIVVELIQLILIMLTVFIVGLFSSTLGLPGAMAFAFMLCAFAFVYVSLSFAVALVIQDNLPALKALQISFLITKKRLRFFVAFYAIFLGLVVVSVFTFFIGFIWVIPLYFHAKGILYRDIFGIELPIKANEVLE